MLKKSGIIFIIFLLMVSIFLFFNKQKVYYALKNSRVAQKLVSKAVHFNADNGAVNSAAIAGKYGNTKLNISISSDAPIGKIKNFYNGIGMGSFNDGVLKEVNRAFFKMIAETNKEHDFVEYVGMKSIFKDELKKWGADDGAHVVKRNASGKIVYQWKIVDAVIDELVNRDGLKPIISFTFMPEVLAANPGRVNPWHKGIVSLPREFKEWRDLIYETVRHLKNRYGATEVRSWYFEVWNEPDYYQYFWVAHPDKKQFPKQSDHDSFCKFYDYTVDGALAADPLIRIGGPGLAGDRRFLRQFLKHCYTGTNFVTGQKGTRLDFISRHHYGMIEERIVPQYKSFMDEVKKYAGSAFKELEILITETGPSALPKPWLNNQYVAAWIVKQLDAFLTLGDDFGDEYIPDNVCFWAKPVAVQFGKQFGLVGTTGDKHKPLPKDLLKRPAFNAFKAVRLLGDTRLQLTGANFGDPVHGIAARNGNSDIDVLLYQLKEGDYYNSALNEFDITLEITGCDRKDYALEYYAISDKFSNCYDLWLSMGSPQFPTLLQRKRLKEKEGLELVQPVRRVKTENGTVSLNVLIQANSVAFVRLKSLNDTTRPSAPADLNVRYEHESRTVDLNWTAPDISADGDYAAAYEIYRNNTFIKRLFTKQYVDKDVQDGENIIYSVRSLDDAGNLSNAAASFRISIPKDIKPPEIKKISMPNESTIIVHFDEPLDPVPVDDMENFTIEPNIKIYTAQYKQKDNAILFDTGEHAIGKQHQFCLKNMRDRASSPNFASSLTEVYSFNAHWEDNFNSDTLDDYLWTGLQGPSNHVRRIYDDDARNILVMTGDDTRIQFTRKLPKTEQGRFSLRFSPFMYYPDGGAITIYLKQNKSNYYSISNTHGYGPGIVRKVIDGTVVDSLSFKSEYRQNRNYDISVAFQPAELKINSFNENLLLDRNRRPIHVERLEIQLTQQDARFDNLVLSRD